MTADLDRLRAALADRYTLERELGRGGMATVYLARDLKHDRFVALKVLRPELAATLGPERFLHEIRTTAQLDHPNIVALYDSGRTGGRADGRTDDPDDGPTTGHRPPADAFLYYVMPHIEGESLRDRLEREGQLPLEEALQLTRAIAEALSYAHSRGIVHRDIKPENILLSGGHARVADFGIAKAVTEAGGENLTETGLAIGTPAYMSPEQAEVGQAVDGRSDLYSLGCVLYEMLAGHPPFQGNTAHELLARHALDPVPPLKAARKTIPAPIEAAIERALEKAPADRFATATQFSQALASDVTRPAPRRRTAIRLRRWAIGAAALALVVGGAYGAWRYRAATSWRRVPLDANLIAVLPFRSPSDSALDESVVDLFYYGVLDGTLGPHAVEPNVLIRRWRAWGEGAGAGEEDPRRLAASFGAGQVLEGAASIRGGQLRLSASLRGTGDGALRSEYLVTGAPDSVAALVRALAIGLLGRRLGEEPERIGRLADRDPTAVRAYLEGLQHERAGRAVDAIAAFDDAVARDSGFALAVLALLRSRTWQVGRYFSLGNRLRDSLSPRDRAEFDYLRTLIRWDSTYTNSDLLKAARNLVAAYPHDPEAFLSLADALRRAGPRLQLPDWEAQARAAAAQAWILDSTTPNLVGRQWQSGAQHGTMPVGDLDDLRRYGPRYVALLDTAMPPQQRWLLALALGDSTTVKRFRARLAAGDASLTDGGVREMSPHFLHVWGLPADDGHALLALWRGRVGTHADSISALVSDFDAALEEGRMREVLRIGDALLGAGADCACGGCGPNPCLDVYFSAGLLGPGLRPLSANAAMEMQVHVRRNPTDRWNHVLDCYSLVWRAVLGDTLGVRTAARDLAPRYAAGPRGWTGDMAICPVMVEAMLDRHGPDVPPSPAMLELDRLTREAPWDQDELNMTPWLLSRMWRAHGEIGRALAWSRARVLDERGLRSRLALLREEGALAALAGDTAAAIKAYETYLQSRVDPDDLARPQVDSVRAALQGLLRAKG